MRIVHDVASGTASWWLRRRREPAADGAAALMMVHGLGTSGASLVRPMLALGPALDPWAADLPGFGATSTPEHALDLAELADGLVGWVDEVGLDRAASLLPDARTIVLPGAHALTYSHPGELAAAIEGFLAEGDDTDRG